MLHTVSDKAVLLSLLQQTTSDLRQWLCYQNALGANHYSHSDHEAIRLLMRQPIGRGIPSPHKPAVSQKPTLSPSQDNTHKITESATPTPQPAVSRENTHVLKSLHALTQTTKQRTKPTAAATINASEQLAELMEQCKQCRQCALAQQHGILAGEGPSRADVFNVGLGLNPYEHRAGRIFADADDQFSLMLSVLGLTRSHVFLTNLIKCRVDKNMGFDKETIQKLIQPCLAHLNKEIDVVKPKVIIAWGQYPYNALMGNKLSFDEAIEQFYRSGNKTSRKFYQYRGYNLVPMYHPRYLELLRMGKFNDKFSPDQITELRRKAYSIMLSIKEQVLARA